MKIGIDASRIARSEKSGTENYSLNLIKALAKIDQENYYVLYFNELPSFFEISQPNFASRVIPASRFWTQLRLATELVLHPVDLLFVPAHTLPVLKRPGIRTVVTIHDLGAEYLANYHKYPDRIYLNWATRFAARFSDQIIAVSKATKADLRKRLGTDPRKINVVYEGVNREFYYKRDLAEVEIVRKKYGLRKKYLLFVGTIQPRKNLLRLIEAFAKTHLGLDLVLAGQTGWLYGEILAAPKKFRIEEKVKFLGFVPSEDLPALYSGATAFVFPSLYEGFGLPILEAMACGLPVLTSNLSSLPEIAGGAALEVDPYKISDIAQGLITITNKTNLRESLIAKGQERVANFSWEKTAQETLAVFEKVMKKTSTEANR